MTRTLLIFFALAGAFSVAAYASSIDEVLPQQLEDAQGHPVSRDTLQGKLIGLYFSAEWCPPCRAFTPNLVKFRNDHKDKFEVVFISRDRTPEAHRSYMANYKMDFLTVKHDPDFTARLQEKYRVRTIPTMIVLDPEGNVITRDGRWDVARDASNALAKWRGGKD
jgi:thiol-disulfide isomerase/thioredoxin